MNDTEKIYQNELVERIVPIDFRGGWATFDTTRPEHARMKIEARAWVETFGQRTPAGLRLAGAVGCGKTRTAYAIIEALIRRGVYRIKAINSIDFFQQIRATYDTPGESERGIIEHFLDCRVLLIDDIGVETGRNTDKFQFVLERFFLILDRAQRTHRPTIITTSNLYLSELRKLWGAGMGERVVDRLGQLTEDLGVFPDESMRKSQKARNRGGTNAEKSHVA